MAESPVRNPSPPPLDDEDAGVREVLEADIIPGTAYSKKWLFSTLLKLLGKVEGLHQNSESDNQPSKDSDVVINNEKVNGQTHFILNEKQNGSGQSPLSANEQTTTAKAGDKIDEQTENELCQLWDMTAEGEVVKLLMEYSAIDLLVGAIYKSVGVEPRYTEIAVGILGNMACQKEACAVMAADTKVMELIYWILQISTDAPLLVETTRLVTTIFDSIKEQESTPWIETLYGRCVIKKGTLPLIEDKTVLSTVSPSDALIVKPDPATIPSISRSIVFILQSSSRLDLLRNTLKFLDQIFECDRAADLVSALMHIWVVEYDLIEALLEAWNTVHDDHEDVQAIDSWMHVMYLICQTCDMETRKSDRSSVSLKVGIIGTLPKKASAILQPVSQYLRWCLEADEVASKWYISIACGYNIAQALLVHSMTSLEVIEVTVKLFHRILVKWPIRDLKRRLKVLDRDRNEVMTDKLLKYTFDSVFAFFSFVFARIIRDRTSPIIQNVVRTFEKCPMSTLRSMSDLLDNWHKDEATVTEVSPLNPGIGAFASPVNPLPKVSGTEPTIAEVIGEMLRVAEERGTKKLAHVISSTVTATTYTATTYTSTPHTSCPDTVP